MDGANMKWNYVVTAHKSTAVTHSCVGNFTSPLQLNLIIGKCTRFEIHSLSSEGRLMAVLDFPIYGRIATLELFRPNGEKQDFLFITTERHEYFVLQWDVDACKLITRTKGDLADQTGHPMDKGQIGMIDPDCRLIGVHLSDGLFKVIPFGKEGKLKEPFSIRFDPLALDIKFLYGCPEPTVVVIYQDTNGGRSFKAYEVPLEAGPKNTEQRAFYHVIGLSDDAFLMPLSQPVGGVLVFQENKAVHSPTRRGYEQQVEFRNLFEGGCQLVKAYSEVDPYRYLLGDGNGGLHLLALTHEEEKVTNLKVIKLGKTSIASTISYLRDSIVYIGSRYGDAQLIKVNLQPDAGSHTVEVLNSYDNLGPIGDFCVLEKQGQIEIVTCSGAYKDGSLRIVRKSIGVHEQASVELEGIKGMWSLRSATDDLHDTFLVLNFIGETRFYEVVLGENMMEYEMPDASIEGFNSAVETLFCHDAVFNQLVQVTPSSVRLVCGTSRKLKQEWLAEGPVTVATANATQVLLAIGKCLVCLTIGNGILELMQSVKLPSVPTCLDISPIGGEARFAAVGLWEDRSVMLYSFPGLVFIGKEILGEGLDSLPRSVVMCSLDGKSYLLCGLGEGHLMHFELNMNTGALTDREKVSLGTRPVTLCTFSSKEATRVIAASDCSVVIYSFNKKLLYSETNLKDVVQMCPYNVEAFPDSLAVSKAGKLAICTIDEKQKLYSRSVHLREHALRISHQEQSRTFAICSVEYKDGGDTAMHVRLLDDQTFGIKSTYNLREFEHGCSILSCSFSDDDNAYYCVGTAFMVPNENKCTKGRILVIQVRSGGELVVVAEKKTKGAVYSLNAFNGKLLAAVNENIQLYKWVPPCKDGSGPKLQPEFRHRGRVLSLFVQTRGELIVVGDAMRSISLLIFEDGKIEELARDSNVSWMSAVEILCDDIYLGAGKNLDLFTVTIHSGGALDEKHKRLEVVGKYHLGEYVNRFQRGSLVKLSPDSEMIPTVIFGTVNGVIGVIASLPQKKHEFLEQLQRALRKLESGGGLSNKQWRSSRVQRTTVDSKNFIDGDLIESFLDLSKNLKEKIAQEMKVACGDLVKTVEELTTLH